MTPLKPLTGSDDLADDRRDRAPSVSAGWSDGAKVPRAFAIEVYGTSAGILLADGNRFVFRASHQAFWDLDHRCFARIAHAEKAVHQSWLRRQHRREQAVRFAGRSR